jgi:ribose 5-phosphate isomerase B
MKIAVGSDHAGYEAKERLKVRLEERGHEVDDVGTDGLASVDYPDFAFEVGARVASGACGLGMLVCGSGIGMAIAANKLAGVRAATCVDPYSAAMARRHNDANVLCLGARISGPDLLEAILAGFLDASFEDGRHARRVDKIKSRETEGANR